jgi:hypothetical protein
LQLGSDSATTAFFAVVAFLAGFSERWTRVMLDGAMRTVDRPGSDAGQQPTLPSSQRPPGQGPADRARERIKNGDADLPAARNFPQLALQTAPVNDP